MMSSRSILALALALGALALLGCSSETETKPPPMPAPCDAADVAGLTVTTTDPYGGTPYALGYPPYAVDACALAYVAQPAAGASDGELRLRDLVSGTEIVLAPASERPRRPAIAGDLVAWEATIAGRSVIRVRASGVTTTLAGPFDHAAEPRVALDAVVFTAWLGADEKGDTDVYLYRPSTGMLTPVAMGPGQQRFADVSLTHVAWSDFSEGASGAFLDDPSDAADVVLLDRATNARSVRSMPGKQAFPLLGAEGKIAYLDWGLVHPEPKFSEYDLRLGDLAGAVDSDVLVTHVMTQVPYVRPAARGSSIAWVSSDQGPNALYYRDVAPDAVIERVTSFDGTVFGPSAAESLVLVGASDGAKVALRAFAR
jgi:hypothetical protein